MTVTATALAHSAAQAAGNVPVDNITPGVLGFLVVAAMGIILFFLLRSMNRQLRKIPPPPPEDDGNDDPGTSRVSASPAPPADRAG